MAEAGIVVQPSLEDAGRNDWLVISMPAVAEVPESRPDPRPPAEWARWDSLTAILQAAETPLSQRFSAPCPGEVRSPASELTAAMGFRGTKRVQCVVAPSRSEAPCREPQLRRSGAFGPLSTCFALAYDCDQVQATWLQTPAAGARDPWRTA